MNTFFGSVFIARITVSSRNTWTSSHVTWLLWIDRWSGWEKRVASTSMNSSMSRNPCLTRKKKRSANEIHSSHRSPSTSRIWVDVAAANNHSTTQNRRYNIKSNPVSQTNLYEISSCFIMLITTTSFSYPYIINTFIPIPIIDTFILTDVSFLMH